MHIHAQTNTLASVVLWKFVFHNCEGTEWWHNPSQDFIWQLWSVLQHTSYIIRYDPTYVTFSCAACAAYRPPPKQSYIQCSWCRYNNCNHPALLTKQSLHVVFSLDWSALTNTLSHDTFYPACEIGDQYLVRVNIHSLIFGHMTPFILHVR